MSVWDSPDIIMTGSPGRSLIKLKMMTDVMMMTGTEASKRLKMNSSAYPPYQVMRPRRQPANSSRAFD
jgi:hypothetical protein